MLVIAKRQISILVLCVIAIHFWWAAVIFEDEAGLLATSVDSLYRYIRSPELLVFVLTISSCMALLKLVFAWVPWWFLVPQQVLLLFSAAGAIEAMWLGQFADGVLRPHAFLMNDQIYPIILAMGHTLALITATNRSQQNSQQKP